jgi:hypothetical protein
VQQGLYREAIAVFLETEHGVKLKNMDMAKFYTMFGFKKCLWQKTLCALCEL